MSEALPDRVLQVLSGAAAYPHDPSAAAGVDHVQTHISHVFLTGERVYKFRKDVDLGFVDFSTRAERDADCLREVSLNRRLAPDVYLGVAALRMEPAGARVGRPTEELVDDAEHCVVMRRLPAARDALSLLEKDQLQPEQLDRLARCIAAFHAAHRLGTPAPFTPEEWLRRCTDPIETNFRVLGEAPVEAVDPAQLDRVRDLARRFIREHADRFEARRLAGRAVDGHGDLHLQHVWFEQDGSEPLVIDCLEFETALRQIDAAADVAFTAMDLTYRRRPELAERFLRVYAGESDDFGLYAVVDYFHSYRAAVRAKVAGLAALDPALEAPQRKGALASAGRHLALAEEALEARRARALVLVGGIIGAGKSSVAEALAELSGAVVIASDRVRKHQLGLAATERASPRRYTPEAKRRVYRGLLERARGVLASGRSVLLDATWSRREDRREAGALAAELGVELRFIEVRCAREPTLARLRRRSQEGSDPSDAGPELYAASAETFEPVDAGSEGVHDVVRTDRPGWRAGLAALARELDG